MTLAAAANPTLQVRLTPVGMGDCSAPRFLDASQRDVSGDQRPLADGLITSAFDPLHTLLVQSGVIPTAREPTDTHRLSRASCRADQFRRPAKAANTHFGYILIRTALKSCRKFGQQQVGSPRCSVRKHVK